MAVGSSVVIGPLSNLPFAHQPWADGVGFGQFVYMAGAVLVSQEPLPGDAEQVEKLTK